MTEFIGLRVVARGLPALSAAEAMWAVDALGSAGFKVTSYKLVDGSRSRRFTREAFEADAPAAERKGCFDLNIKPGILFLRESSSYSNFCTLSRYMKTVTHREVEALLNFSEAIVERGASYLGLSLLGQPLEHRWAEEEVLSPAPPYQGIRGLFPRTYFGPHYVDLFGRELLLSTPAASVTETDGGGVLIDLMEDLAGTSNEELVDTCWRCTEHLRPAGVFAEMIRDEERKRVTFKMGPNFSWAPEPPPQKKPEDPEYERLLTSEKDGPVPDVDIEGRDFSFKSLDGVQAESLKASELNAEGSSWRRCFLDCPALGEANFKSAALDESSMVDPYLVGADFTDAGLRHVVWSSPLAIEATFDGADLTGASLSGASFRGGSFRGAKLIGATLDHVSFRDCDLRDADFSGANLEGADFTGANLEGAKFDDGVSPDN